MLTARDAIDDRISGLDTGADDYLVKPFAFSELLARLRAIARRAPAERPTELRVGDLRLDPATHRAWRGDAELDLTAKEFVLLEVFMRRPGEVLSRVQLLDAAWDLAFESHSNVVDVYVRYLREKIDRPFGRNSLETVRGVGYRLSDVTDMSRLPIRIRLTLPFALAMALVLAALGAFVYVRVGSTLLSSTDQSLLAQATEATLRVDSGKTPLDLDSANGARLAQVLDASGASRPLPADGPSRAALAGAGSHRRRRRLAADERCARRRGRRIGACWQFPTSAAEGTAHLSSPARSTPEASRSSACGRSCSSPHRSRFCLPRSPGTRWPARLSGRSRRCGARQPRSRRRPPGAAFRFPWPGTRFSGLPRL